MQWFNRERGRKTHWHAVEKFDSHPHGYKAAYSYCHTINALNAIVLKDELEEGDIICRACASYKAVRPYVAPKHLPVGPAPARPKRIALEDLQKENKLLHTVFLVAQALCEHGVLAEDTDVAGKVLLVDPELLYALRSAVKTAHAQIGEKDEPIAEPEHEC